MIRIAIDGDGIVSNFVEGFNRILNEIHPGAIPRGYEPDDWNGWVKSGLVTFDEQRTAWSKVRDTPGLWLGLEPYRDNLLSLRRYLEEKPSIIREAYLLTSRMATGGETAQYQTEAWLRKYEVRPLSVIVVDRMEDKVKIATTLKFTAVIDDNLETVYDLRNAGVNAYLLDRPWNRVKTDFEDYRVSSLREFLQLEGGPPQ